MSKILVLADSGFGKTTSIGCIPELGITGLNPQETFIISSTSKPLPFRKSAELYPVVQVNNFKEGRRVVSYNTEDIIKVINGVLHPKSPFKNLVMDDFNYIMQNYYMSNALKGGWDKMGVPA